MPKVQFIRLQYSSIKRHSCPSKNKFIGLFCPTCRAFPVPGGLNQIIKVEPSSNKEKIHQLTTNEYQVYGG